MKVDKKGRIVVSEAAQKNWGWKPPLPVGEELMVATGTDESTKWCVLAEGQDWRNKILQAAKKGRVGTAEVFCAVTFKKIQDPVGHVGLGADFAGTELTPAWSVPEADGTRMKLLLASPVTEVRDEMLQKILDILAQQP